MSENEIHEVEQPKPSKLDRIKSAAIMTGVLVIPTAMVAGSMFASLKMCKMQLETARLNLEAAKLNKS